MEMTEMELLSMYESRYQSNNDRNDGEIGYTIAEASPLGQSAAATTAFNWWRGLGKGEIK